MFFREKKQDKKEEAVEKLNALKHTDNLKLIEQLIQAKLKYPIHYLWKGKNNNYTKLEIFTLNCFEVSFTHLVKEWVEDKTTVSIEDIALLSTNLYPEIKLLSKKI